MAKNSNHITIKGLITYDNELTRTRGALTVADNIVIDNDNVACPRRGYKQCGDVLPTEETRHKQLLQYKERIIRHYDNIFEVALNDCDWCQIPGEYQEVCEGLRIKFQESNQNLYFTTNEGIKKLAAKTTNDICEEGRVPDLCASPAVSAGAPKALDGNVTTVDDVSGYLCGESKAAYKVVFGTKDVNDNLILGTPSVRVIVTNSNEANQDFEITTIDSSGGLPSEDEYILIDAIQAKYLVYNDYSGNAIQPITSDSVGREIIRLDLQNVTTNQQWSTVASNTINNLADFNTSFVTTTSFNIENTQPGDADDTSIGVANPSTSGTIVVNTTTQGTAGSPEEYEINISGIPKNNEVILFETVLGSYVIWFKTKSTDTAPSAIPGGRTQLEVDVITAGSFTDVMSEIKTVIDNLGETVTTLVVNPSSETLEIVNNTNGDVVDASYELYTQSTGNVTATKVQDGVDEEAIKQTPTVCFTVPEGITENFFYQIYRTRQVTATEGLNLADIDPGEEFNLIFESPVTSTDITNKEVCYEDRVPDSFRERGAFLYTNPNTGDGILQTNDPPPLAKDLALFRQHMFYANTKQPDRLQSSITSVDDFTAGVSDLTITNGVDTCTFNFVAPGTSTMNTEVEVETTGSTSQNIDGTARNLVSAINKEPGCPVNAFYISGPSDLPGQIVYENKDVNGLEFFLTTTDPAIANEFDPPLPLAQTVDFQDSNVTITNGDTQIVTDTPHGFTSGNTYFLSIPGTNINGFFLVNAPNTTTFTIQEEIVLSAGPTYTITNYTSSSKSNIDENVNRVYYSKLGQPEAVPSLANFFDVGPKDEPIHRIISLRDNLFVLKTDGIYIISGTVAPNFTVRLWDGSAQSIAPDSATVLDNRIYMLSKQGIIAVNTSGVDAVSRPIENKILDVITKTNNFSTVSFGVSYETDRSYHLWLPTDREDQVATQCFRYNTFTRAWTRWTISATCGLVSENDDKLYLGSGDCPYTLQERKDLNRLDYADKEFSKNISLYSNPTKRECLEPFRMLIDDLTNVEVGDAIVQDQYVTICDYNTLLTNLDNDPNLADDYVSTLEIVAGVNIATALDALNLKLNGEDSNITIQTYSGSFLDIKTSYDLLIDDLNSPTTITKFKDYRKTATLAPYEALILDIDIRRNILTVSNILPYLEGPITLYKGIKSFLKTSDITYGDPSSFKQIREATMLYKSSAFYGGEFGFSTDLSPSEEFIGFLQSGNGSYIQEHWDQTNVYWGGCGNKEGFRSLVPRNKQRCRYIQLIMRHGFARDKYALIGFSTVAREFSSRAYRQG